MNMPDPLAFDSDNLDQLEPWLHNIKKLNASHASSELHQVLLTLLQKPQPPDVKLAILDQLLEPVQYYADQLETLIIKEVIRPKALVVKTAKLSSQLLSNLSLNYCQVCKSTELSQQQLHSSLFLGLHLIGLSLYKQAIFKQCPSTRLWKKSADLYQLALKNKLFEQSIADITSIDTDLKNLKAVLQRNLLFSICDPYHFQSKLVKQLFKFADAHFASLKIDDHGPFADFVWILNQENSPIPFNKIDSIKDEAIYIDCKALLKQFLEPQALNFSELELNHLKLRLSGYEEILDNIIPAAPKQCQLILDHTQIPMCLNRFAAMENIRRISDESGSKSSHLEVLQLELLHTQRVVTSKNAIDSGTKDKNPLYSSSVYNTRSNDFIVASVPLLPLQIEQPVLILKSTDPVQLGVIKQIVSNPTHNNLRILIQLELGLIYQVNLSIGTEQLQAILIKHETGQIDALLPPASYANNTKIHIKSRSLLGTYLLDELRESTPFFMRFPLIPTT